MKINLKNVKKDCGKYFSGIFQAFHAAFKHILCG